jgi:SRSO17 transposase
MTKVPKIKYKEVGNLYGLRNWVEYGLKQSKNEQTSWALSIWLLPLFGLTDDTP